MARHMGVAGMLAAICAALPAPAAPPAEVPVVIQGDGLMDACATLARPVGLRRGGDGYLSLRAGPGVRFRETLRLTGADRLLVCGERGDWSAVLVQASGQDCGATTPSVGRARYRGPCRSGWVATRFLEVLAG